MADPTNTVTSQFLAEITTEDTGAGTSVSSLEEMNSLFTSWVEVLYHQSVHSTTGQSPIHRWDAGWDNRRPRRKDPEVIAEAFRWSATRTVSKSATVSLHSNTYQVDPLLAGARVELIYDPFDLTAPLTVTTAEGMPAGQAALLEITRHVHPKAANAAKDTDHGATQASSGVDYLRLIADQHKDAITAGPISFTTLTGSTSSTDTADPDDDDQTVEEAA